MKDKKYTNLFFLKYKEDNKIFSDSKIQIPKSATIAEIDTSLIDLKNGESHLEKKLERVVKYPDVRIPYTQKKPKIDPSLHSQEIHSPPDWTDRFDILWNNSLTSNISSYIPWFQMITNAPIPSSCKFNFSHQPVRAMDWNSKSFVFAVALQDQNIYFFDVKNQKWSSQTLEHTFHQKITCIKWRPDSEHVLAVGTEHGVLLWDMSKHLGTRLLHKFGICIFLKVEGFGAISSLDWHPSGNSLIVASHHDHRLIHWKLDEKEQPRWDYHILERFNGGITKVGFSPNGHFLVSFHLTNVFRIWETKSWTCEKWYNTKNYTSTFAWSANSKFLMFAEQGDQVLHCLKFIHDFPTISGQVAFSIDFERQNQMCGIIQEIVCDPHGERIAILFEDPDENGQQLIGLLRSDFVSLNTQNHVLPVGFVRGPKDFPLCGHLNFWKGFNKGSLLSCVWTSEDCKESKIGFIPLYYQTE